MKHLRRNQSGEGIISILVAMAIFSILLLAISAFELSVFRAQKRTESQSQVDQRNIKFLHDFTKLVRAAQPAADSSYLIESATDTDFVFYSDIGGNGIIDRVHYFVQNNSMKQGIVAPSGNPPTYNLSNEVITTIVPSVTSTANVFTYYDGSYDGNTNITPLPTPIVVADIRTVKVNFTVDPNVKNVQPSTVTTQVTIRNIKSLE